MESRANYAAIGLFVLVMLMTGLGFLYWLTNAGEQAKRASVRVIFSGAVTGLNTGSGVLFNGIRVGEVADLQLDPQDPNTVIAIVNVDRTKPIKTDTRAILSYQGLTGVANLQLEGGSRNAPLLLDSVKPEDGMPTIHADISPFQDILESAKNVLQKADNAMGAIDDFISENGPAFNRTVNNVETFSKALADNAPAIDDALASVGKAADSLAGISDSVKGSAARAEEILNAIDPARVTTLVQNMTDASNRLNQVLARAEEVATGIDPAIVNQAVQNVADAAGELRQTIDQAQGVMAAIKPEDVTALVGSLRQSSDDIGSAVRKAQDVLAAVDAEKIGTIVDNVDVATKNLADVSATVGGAVDTARDAVVRAGELVGAVDPAKVRGAVDDVAASAGALRQTADQAKGVVAAVKPEDVEALVSSLKQNSADVGAAISRAQAVIAAVDAVKIGTIVTNADVVARNLADVSGTVAGVVSSASDAIAKAGAVVGAVDPEKVRGAVENVASFTQSLSQYGPQVDGILGDVRSASASLKRLGETIDLRNRDVDLIITDARNLASQLNGIANRTDAILQKVDGYVTGDGQGLVAEAGETLKSIRQVADNINGRVGPIADDVSKFTSRGLGSFTSLAEDGRRALDRLNRVLSGVEQNPQQFIFGGQGVPEYNPRRR